MNGKHLIVDFRECQNSDKSGLLVKAKLLKFAKEAGMTVIDSKYHNFKPQGTTVFVMLAESHISVHTYPEHKYVAMDVYLCGQSDPYVVLEGMRKVFGSKHFEVRELNRG